MRRLRSAEMIPLLDDDPLWYKDAVIYELHVRTFFDSDGDGIGDFRGLTEKLDYLQDLGITALWLLPFYPSPLKDDGYDIADYVGVHPAYGTVDDFVAFLREAHRRGIRVITELVLNHTSDQHPVFQRARQPRPRNRWRDFYVWSDTPDKYPEARIIFKDFESSNWSWDPVAKAYYWHRFYAHQPDLNYDNPYVWRSMFRVVDFWFGMGVDGLRLDAVPYLYEREGTNCENLPETHRFLKALRRHVDERFRNRMLLAEANQWPEDAVAYFGNGDECHMAFHFPLMPRLFMALRMEDRFPIIDIMEQTPSIPETAQWALFLRNHDELTLEMVTDEERDYMYRVYAYDAQMRINLGIRRRLAPLLGNDRKKIELIKGLLFSLPGTPVIYYGDEIGMGDNFYLGDRNGVRTPMQWSGDRNAGFSRANPQRLYLPVIIDPEYHYEAINVEAQQSNPDSLLWWMKRLIAMRKRYKAFGRGTIEFLRADNHKVLAFVRRYQEQNILVIANLSRFAQFAHIDLAEFKGTTPLEVFGRTWFPAIGDQPYPITLGPHAFYWFDLTPQRAEAPVIVTAQAKEQASLTVSGSWDSVFHVRERAALEAVLPRYLHTQRWFGGKARTVLSAEVREAIPVPREAPVAYVTFVHVEYAEGEPETYILPLAFATGEQAALAQQNGSVLARLHVRGRGAEEDGVLHDALADRAFAIALFEAIAQSRSFGGEFGDLLAAPTRPFRPVLASLEGPLEPSVLQTEQSNTSVVYGDRFILKFFRRLEEGTNPDLEIGRVLTERRALAQVPSVAGALEYRQRTATPLTRLWRLFRGEAKGIVGRPYDGEPMTVAILHNFVANQGDAWRFTLDALGRYFEQVLTRQPGGQLLATARMPLAKLVEKEPPELAFELIGPYLESARLLGQRTAELHLALAQEVEDERFAPEPFTELYQRSLYQRMRSLSSQVFDLLRSRVHDLPDPVRGEVQRLLDREGTVLGRFRTLMERRITGKRLRTHGDYHLGQVLYTGKDFVIIDFEGEPARPVSERRIKRSPLRDVAGMLRSFHYASSAALYGQVPGVRPEDFPSMEPWARFWYSWVSATFLKSYLAHAARGDFLPRGPEETNVLLEAFLLEKALYEVGYELNNRPEWVRIPLRGILELLGAWE